MLFAVPPRAKGRLRAARAGSATPFTCIGALTKHAGCVLTRRRRRRAAAVGIRALRERLMPPLLPARRVLFAIVVVAAVLFVFVTRIRDSTEEAFDANGRPRLGTALRFEATAYCKGETTAAGVAVRAGMAAADPALLPLGSVVSVQTQTERQNGIWTVLDTGPRGEGAGTRPLHLELQRGAGLRTPDRAGHDPASGLGPAEQRAVAGRAVVPAA